MNRISGYIDSKHMEARDVSEIMQDSMVTLQLMRKEGDDDKDGFTENPAYKDYTLVANIKGRIDRKNAVYIEKNGEISRATINVYIGTLYYKDVRPGDQLICGVGKYQVETVSSVDQTFVECDLELIS